MYQLHRKAQQYLTLGLAPTTRATYSSGLQKVTSFCTTAHKSPIPTSKETLLLFVYQSPPAISHIARSKLPVCSQTHGRDNMSVHSLWSAAYSTSPVNAKWHQKESSGLLLSKSASTNHTSIDAKNLEPTSSTTWFLWYSYDNIMITDCYGPHAAWTSLAF